MTEEIGFVKKIKNFLVYVEGLPTARINDLVTCETGAIGFVSGLLPNLVEILLLTQDGIKPGQSFRPLRQELSVPVGDFLFGRVVSPLGQAVDGKGTLSGLSRNKQDLAPLNYPAPGMAARRFITSQFDSGVTLIDTLIPLGKGQRELVIGDGRSGKTGFLIDVIVNQKNTGVVCVYGALGKPASEIRNLVDILRKNGAMDYTVMVASFSGDADPLIFLTPQTAFTVANYFQRKGKDVLLLLDDMGSHARIYREISLLSERPPGREAYPGDIFYQHAHLLERAGCFDEKMGGGTITAIPMIELDLADFTTFIPTNLMSMTDGHLLFKSNLYSQGKRPAVDLFLSVSRVGQQTQNKIASELGFKIKQLLTQSEQLATVASFSVELPLATQVLLRQKAAYDELLRQSALTFVPKSWQVIILAVPLTKFGQLQEQNYFANLRANLPSIFEKNKELADLAKNVFNLSDLSELVSKLEVIASKLGIGLQTSQQGSEVVSAETWLPEI